MSCSNVQTKRSNITYFDEHWKKITSPEKAAYYRIIDRSDNKYIVKDYFKSSRRLQMEAVCSKVEPDLFFNGKATWYYKNGKKHKEGVYKENRLIGLVKIYYDNGSPCAELFYKDEDILFIQYWAEDGKMALVNGTGFIDREDSELPFSRYREVKDSTVTASYFISHGNDTVYTKAETGAGYAGGFEAFYHELGKNLVGKYPAQARRLGIEGRVFIQCIIDKHGKVKNAHVVRGIGGGCDEVALDAFLKQTEWKPGMHLGNPVNSAMVLPVVFRLN